jgi:hypothetical protein
MRGWMNSFDECRHFDCTIVYGAGGLTSTVHWAKE